MLILSRVCAEFHDDRGRAVFAVTPATRNTFLEAPDSIRADPLFQLLLDEGSLEANLTPAARKALENDPAQGTDAAGRKAKPAEKPADKPAEKPAEKAAEKTR